MGAVLKVMGQICNADQVSDDSPCCKLCQVGFHQGDFFLYLGTLVQNTQKGLLSKENQ